MISSSLQFGSPIRSLMDNILSVSFHTDISRWSGRIRNFCLIGALPSTSIRWGSNIDNGGLLLRIFILAFSSASSCCFCSSPGISNSLHTASLCFVTTGSNENLFFGSFRKCQGWPKKSTTIQADCKKSIPIMESLYSGGIQRVCVEITLPKMVIGTSDALSMVSNWPLATRNPLVGILWCLNPAACNSTISFRPANIREMTKTFSSDASSNGFVCTLPWRRFRPYNVGKPRLLRPGSHTRSKERSGFPCIRGNHDFLSDSSSTRHTHVAVCRPLLGTAEGLYYPLARSYLLQFLTREAGKMDFHVDCVWFLETGPTGRTAGPARDY